MPSADPGAPAVRPADVERWFVEIGLEPLERADRDGITSWDLLLDGRRRHDLRVTVILDPTLAVIVWAHYAPPIGDMFRKSYRKLLRWNDEFPFVKFSVGEDERPLLASELPIDTCRCRRARPGDRAHPRCRRPPPRRDEGLAVDRRRGPGRAGRPRRAEPRVPGSIRGPPAPDRRTGSGRGGQPGRWPVAGRRIRDRRRRARHVTALARRLGPLVLALVFVAGLTAAPTGVAEVRAATPDLTIVSDARYDVQPNQSRVRVTVTLRLTNHLKDTATKRYYFDQAFLAVLPGASGMRLTGAGSPGVSVSRRTANATILRLKLGARLFSGQVRHLHPAIRPCRSAAARRPVTCASGRRSCPSRSGRSPRTRRRAAR